MKSLNFLGKEVADETAKSIAYGDTDPVSHVKFETSENEKLIVEKALRRGKTKKGVKGNNIFANNFGGKGGGQGFNFRHGGANF